MSTAYLRAVPVAGLLALAGVSGCAAKPASSPVQPPPPAPPADLVVLLADPDGSIGAVDVSNAQGTTGLAALRAATRVVAGQAPSAAEAMSESEVDRLFGAALAAMPPPAQRFTLYFRFESEELTPESRASIPNVLDEVKRHPAPEVLVVGHTDTTGPPDRNVRLGLRRALTVRDMLVANQLDRSAIEVTSHGESDPLVQTADEVFEPRNRRVDITVR